MSDYSSYPLCRTPTCRTAHEPGYADRGLCGWCEDRGLEAITTLPTDWADLQPLIWDKETTGPADSTGPTPFGPTLPIDLGADALAGEIAYTVVVWEIAVRDRARLPDALGQDRMCGWPELRVAACTLAAHYSVLVALGPIDHEDYDRREATADGPDAVVALTALHRRARARVGVTSRVTTLPGACPGCGRSTIRHRDGADDVWCATCRTRWPWDAYQDYIAIVPLGRAA